MGRPRALDRNATVTWPYALPFSVLLVRQGRFHNAKSGVCFPSYERIAEAAGCARSTVAEAVKALEVAGMRRPYSPSLRLCPLAETITLRVLAGNFDFWVTRRLIARVSRIPAPRNSSCA